MPGLEELVRGLPPTDLYYLRDSYAKAHASRVVSVVKDGKNSYLVASSTIFHPKSGGQPSDTGFVRAKGGVLEVKKAMGVWLDGYYYVVHFGKGSLETDTGEVTMEINWDARYLYMRRHTAAHLLDHCLAEATGKKAVTLGSWLGDEPYLDYAGPLPSEQQIEKAVELENRYVESDLPVTFDVVPAEKAADLDAPNEERLPKGARELRLVRVGDFEWIPCGGTHVKSTREIGQFSVKSVQPVEGGFRIYFSLSRRPSARQGKAGWRLLRSPALLAALATTLWKAQGLYIDS